MHASACALAAETCSALARDGERSIDDLAAEGT